MKENKCSKCSGCIHSSTFSENTENLMCFQGPPQFIGGPGLEDYYLPTKWKQPIVAPSHCCDKWKKERYAP